MRFLKEFKEFAVKGNMVDIAIGIIIGAAFNEVVDTLVKKIMLPPISLLTDGINFESRKLVLREAIFDSGGEVLKQAVTIEYGTLITVFINFIVLGLCTFFIVKLMNKLRNHAQDVKDSKVVTPKDIQLLSDLKLLMEEQNKLLAEQLKKQQKH